MTTVGTIVTRWNRPAEMALRAMDSACGADEILLANSGVDLLGVGPSERHRPEYFDHQCLSWLDAVAALQTDYVTILPDDDWYEPGFIPWCKAALDEGAGYAFTESTIRFPNGETRLNLQWGENGNVMLPAAYAEQYLLSLPYVVTPACCMFRREDLLDSILPRIPGAPRKELSGPDALLTLMPLLWRDYVAYNTRPLSNLGAGEDSTTITFMRDGRAQLLLDTYDDARRFYLAVKCAGYKPT